MRVQNTIEIINEETGKISVSQVTLSNDLDGQEAHDLAVDLATGVLNAFKGADPETGKPL